MNANAEKMINRDNKKELLNQLEEARQKSELYYGAIIDAFANGEEITWEFEHMEECVKHLKQDGYWLVNRFYKGQPIGIGA